MKTRNKNRKSQITSIATAMFRERGYVATSMRDLAAEVGVEAASLYSHISSKEEILNNICFDLANQFLEGMTRVLEAGGNPDQMFRNAVKEHVEVVTKNLDASAVFFNEWKFLSEPDLSLFVDLREEYEAYFRGILENGKEIGFFMIGDMKFTTRMVLSSLNWLYTWYQPDGKFGPKEVANRLCLLILNGLKFKY